MNIFVTITKLHYLTWIVCWQLLMLIHSLWEDDICLKNYTVRLIIFSNKWFLIRWMWYGHICRLQGWSLPKTNKIMFRRPQIELSWFYDTSELLKISSWFLCSRSFSDTLLRFDKFDISTDKEVFTCGRYLNTFVLWRSVKFTWRIWSIEKDVARAFNLFEEKSKIDAADRFDVMN